MTRIRHHQSILQFPYSPVSCSSTSESGHNFSTTAPKLPPKPSATSKLNHAGFKSLQSLWNITEKFVLYCFFRFPTLVMKQLCCVKCSLLLRKANVRKYIGLSGKFVHICEMALYINKTHEVSIQPNILKSEFEVRRSCRARGS